MSDERLYEVYGDVQYIKASIDSLLVSHKELALKFDDHLSTSMELKERYQTRLDKLAKRVDKMEWKVGGIVVSALFILQTAWSYLYQHLPSIFSER